MKLLCIIKEGRKVRKEKERNLLDNSSIVDQKRAGQTVKKKQQWS